jgi:hypothetical protein
MEIALFLRLKEKVSAFSLTIDFPTVAWLLLLLWVTLY